MTAIAQAYINALLANVSYADVTQGMEVDAITEKLSTSMTPPLAAYIAANFEVIYSIDTSDIPGFGSGFDAMVWRGRAGGEFSGQVYVSTRGTEPLPGADLVTDGDLATSGVAHNQLRDMVNWWLRGITPVGQTVHQIATRESPGPLALIDFVLAESHAAGTGELVGVTQIQAVNGHSLGGYLATAFARLFGAQLHSVNTYNSAGFLGLAGLNIKSSFDQLAQLVGGNLGLADLDSVGSRQKNYFAANGLNVTTNSWADINFLMPGFNQYGARQGLYQEDVLGLNPIANHGMYKLADQLALGTALEKLDPSFTFEKLNAIVKAGSSDMAGSYEGILDSLRRALLGPDEEKLPASDAADSDPSRVIYHEKLDSLQKSRAFKDLTGKLRIEMVSGNLTDMARTDFGALVALQDLSPMYFSGIDAAAQAQS